MNKKSKALAICKFLIRRYGKRIQQFVKKQDIFKILIACILSQRTRDENTARATSNLFRIAKTAKDVLALSNKRLEKLIKPSGMYKQKAKRIKQVCKILVEKYDGKVPKTRAELLKLPGVGYKTADIVRCYGYGIPTIAIDTHCNRIPKRLGLVNQSANVEEVRKKLESLFPKEKHYLINLGLVQFGKEICKPIGPKCSMCPIKDICKTYHFKFHR